MKHQGTPMTKGCYIASNATVVGDVILGEGCSVWYGAVIRGDETVRVGACTNLQDNCVLHGNTRLGNYNTVGHSAIVHGCVTGDYCLIGMGSIILDGAELGDCCVVGAGAVVTGKMKAPAGSMLLGNPARITGSISEDLREKVHSIPLHYLESAKEYFTEE